MSNIEVPHLTLNSSRTIPQLGLGTYLMEGETCYNTVREALNLGYRHIDTATVYQNETEVGKALAEGGVPRDELFITTKLANSEQTDPFGGFERSLDRLGLNAVDLYLLHWPLPLRRTATPAWEAIVRIKESGRAHSVGVCNYEVEHLEALINDTGVVPSVNQIELHPEHQRADLVAFCREQGIAVEAWGPLAQAKSKLLETPAVAETAQALNKTPAQVVLRWHIQHGNIVIPKTSTPARLEENLNIFDFELDEAHMQRIDALETATNYGPDPRSYDG